MRPAERRQDADAPVAQLVAAALDEDGAVVGDDAGGGGLVGEVAHQVLGRLLIEIVMLDQALDRAAGGMCRSVRTSSPMWRPSSSGRPAASAFQNGILPGSPGAETTSTRSCVISSMRQLRGAEQERLADAALEDHLFVELADARAGAALADEEHAVEPAIRNRAAVDDGDALRAFARGERVLQAIPGESRPEVREVVRRIAARQHVEHAFEDRSAQIGERRGAADRVEQLVDVPLVDRHHRDDLLREDVERVARIAARLDARLVHRARDRGAGDEIAAELRHDDAAAGGADGVTGAADALHAARDRRRRLDLHDEIDRAHVDAELERRGRDQAADGAGLQAILDLDPLRPRERSVVRADQRLARELVQRRRQPLGDAPAVDEDQRRPVRPHELEEPRMDRADQIDVRTGPCDAGPLGNLDRLADLRHVLDRHLDSQVEVLLLGGVDDRDRAVASVRRGPNANSS